MAGRVRVLRLRDVPHGGEVGDRQQRQVDQERRPPRDRVDQHPADERPEDRGRRRRAGPDTERASPFLPVEARGDDRQRPRHHERARRALQHARQDQELDVGRDAAQQRRRAESQQAQREHLASPVVVGEATGQDQQGAQGHEVAVRDVRLCLERAHRARGHLPPDLGQGQVHHRRVEEHDGRAEDDGDQRAASRGGAQRDRRGRLGRAHAGIRFTHWARHWGASNGCAK